MLMERGGVRLNATEIGDDRVREALDEPVKMPRVWHLHWVPEYLDTRYTRIGQSMIDESFLPSVMRETSATKEELPTIHHQPL